MINEFVIGGFVIATAGHDSGKCYVIIQTDSEYVYLVDGKIRPLNRPKKKKMLHVKVQAPPDQSLTDKIVSGKVKNEEIKRALKLLQKGYSCKEVE